MASLAASGDSPWLYSPTPVTVRSRTSSERQYALTRVIEAMRRRPAHAYIKYNALVRYLMYSNIHARKSARIAEFDIFIDELLCAAGADIYLVAGHAYVKEYVLEKFAEPAWLPLEKAFVQVAECSGGRIFAETIKLEKIRKKNKQSRARD